MVKPWSQLLQLIAPSVSLITYTTPSGVFSALLLPSRGCSILINALLSLTPGLILLSGKIEAAWTTQYGYYQIVTSALDMDDKEVISTYHELTQIENRFRTMKGTLSTRPIFLSNPDHIDGHNVLCAVALTIIALIQNKLKTSGEAQPKEGQKWFAGMNPDRDQDALNALQVEAFPKSYLV